MGASFLANLLFSWISTLVFGLIFWIEEVPGCLECENWTISLEHFSLKLVYARVRWSFMNDREWSQIFTILIWTVFHEYSQYLIAIVKGFMVLTSEDFWWNMEPWNAMKDHEIPKVQINIVTFCEVSWKFMKFDGIHLSILTNGHESSWFYSLGCCDLLSYQVGHGSTMEWPCQFQKYMLWSG